MNKLKNNIVIIGGGATGACICLHLSHLQSEHNIIIIEPNDIVGVGKAYNTHDSENLLNVSAKNMGLLACDPNHFYKWLTLKNYCDQDFEFWPFVPRKIYGEYLQDCLNPIQYEHIKASAKTINKAENSNKYLIELSNHKIINADFVIVATGYKKNHNTFSHLIAKNNSKRLLYTTEVERSNFNQAKNILIIGTGLSAIDVWKRLRKYSQLDITMISRHGNLPLPHLNHPALDYSSSQFLSLTPLNLFQLLKNLHKSEQLSWQTIADTLRTKAFLIWKTWDLKEKKQFLKYLRPYWEIIRHRVPETLYQILQSDIKNNKLRILSGSIVNLEENDLCIKATLQQNSLALKNYSPCQVDYDYIILATGSKIDDGLFKTSNIKNIEASSYGFGYINNGENYLWPAGPCSKAMHWEITSIPDIRLQAQEISQQITKIIS